MQTRQAYIEQHGADDGRRFELQPFHLHKAEHLVPMVGMTEC